jgi:hypothetical protein
MFLLINLQKRLAQNKPHPTSETKANIQVCLMVKKFKV